LMMLVAASALAAAAVFGSGASASASDADDARGGGWDRVGSADAGSRLGAAWD